MVFNLSSPEIGNNKTLLIVFRFHLCGNKVNKVFCHIINHSLLRFKNENKVIKYIIKVGSKY